MLVFISVTSTYNHPDCIGTVNDNILNLPTTQTQVPVQQKIAQSTPAIRPPILGFSRPAYQPYVSDYYDSDSSDDSSDASSDDENVEPLEAGSDTDETDTEPDQPIQQDENDETPDGPPLVSPAALEKLAQMRQLIQDAKDLMEDLPNSLRLDEDSDILKAANESITRIAVFIWRAKHSITDAAFSELVVIARQDWFKPFDLPLSPTTIKQMAMQLPLQEIQSEVVMACVKKQDSKAKKKVNAYSLDTATTIER